MTKHRILLFLGIPLLGALLIAGLRIGDRSGTFYGPATPLGDGTVRTVLTRESDGQPLSIGVLLSDGALNNLPAEMPPAGPAHETVLALPRQARDLPFDHVSVDWNPMGHEPEGLYALPHFDVHFYMMTEAERNTIDPTAGDFEVKAGRQPDGAFLPANHVLAPGAVPRMGAHWVDLAAPEMNGQPFSTTFIYGTWDGNVTFLEPMITKGFVESVREMEGQMFEKAIPQPEQVQVTGYYPTLYSIQYDDLKNSYALILGGLTLRTASQG
jgi:hypothetical protein